MTRIPITVCIIWNWLRGRRARRLTQFDREFYSDPPRLYSDEDGIVMSAEPAAEHPLQFDLRRGWRRS